jgi:hypothetical protein
MEIDVNPYHAQGALNRALKQKQEFDSYGNFSSLLYSALDTRLCIERTLFTYLLLIKDNELSRRLESLYDATNLKKAILREEPAFFRKIEFCRLLAPFLGYTTTVVSPNLNLLSRCYGVIGNYLHIPKRTFETWTRTEWWAKLQRALGDAIPHLVEIHSGHLATIELKGKGIELFERFRAEKLSAAELLREFKRGMQGVNPSHSKFVLSPKRSKTS